MIKNITSKQQKVLNYFENYIKQNGFAPTYQQAGNDLEISPSVVFNHIKNLEKKGYLISSGKEKSIQILSDSQTIPLIGEIACGEPISVYESCGDYIDVPKTMLRGGGNFYGLKAVGRSMINAGINNGDFLIIRKQNDVNDGDIGVVIIGDYADEENATLKKVYHSSKSLILKPENDNFPITTINNGQIRGKLIGIIRNY